MQEDWGGVKEGGKREEEREEGYESSESFSGSTKVMSNVWSKSDAFGRRLAYTIITVTKRNNQGELPKLPRSQRGTPNGKRPIRFYTPWAGAQHPAAVRVLTNQKNRIHQISPYMDIRTPIKGAGEGAQTHRVLLGKRINPTPYLER